MTRARILERFAALVIADAPGGVACASGLTLAVLASAEAWPGLGAAALAATTLALWATVFTALAAGVQLVLERLWTAPRRPAHWRAAAVALGASVAVTAAVVLPLRVLAIAFVPQTLAWRERIAWVAAVHAATGLGALASFVWWRRRRNWPHAYPFWTWSVLHLAAVVASANALRYIAAGREGPLLAVSFVFCFVCCLGVRAPASTRMRRVLRAAVVVWLGLVVYGGRFGGGSAAARDAMQQELRGAWTMLRWMRNPLDFDGDAFPAVLAGTDCDDTDPGVYPTALEIDGNGIDDNCMGGDAPRPAPAPPVTRRPDAHARSVLVVTVDALRADMLAPEAPIPDPMPALRRFAAKSAWFTRAYAQANATGPSLQSFWTGHYPMSFQDDHGGWLGSPRTVAQYLKPLGYATFGLHQVWQTDPATGRPLAPADWTVLAGFDEVDDSLAVQNRDFRGATSRETTDRALVHLQRLARTGKPFLAWVHYMDPHAEHLAREDTPFSGHGPADRYRQEVWSTDREVGRLLDAIERGGFLRDGYVCVMSDHGELVGEHGIYGHGRWVYEPVLRTVLLLAGPDVPRGRFDTRVRLVDVAPTLLDRAAGLAVPAEGRSLEPVWTGRERAPRDVFAQGTYGGTNHRVAIVGSHKLSRQVLEGVDRLVDLDADPDERRNLAEQEPGTYQALLDAMGRRWDSSMSTTVLGRRVRDEAATAGGANAIPPDADPRDD